jgi:hypothetical protein
MHSRGIDFVSVFCLLTSCTSLSCAHPDKAKLMWLNMLHSTWHSTQATEDSPLVEGVDSLKLVMGKFSSVQFRAHIA